MLKFKRFHGGTPDGDGPTRMDLSMGTLAVATIPVARAANAVDLRTEMEREKTRERRLRRQRRQAARRRSVGG